MYGSLSRVQANNHKAKLADSYTQLLRSITENDVKTIGNYTISKLIGEGSFGKVYLATHRFTHSKVVLKSSLKDQPHLVREIHHHRLFKHPHIARLYEVIITDTLVWLVLEYCPGEELYTYLVKNQRLAKEDAKRMFSQLVGAVAYTHSKNCTHRDLKLENVMLDKKHNVKLLDFGFTREYEPRTLLETVCGTTCYMAPEMLLNRKYNGELVDVWSLGVILYSLLYGQMPFDEDSDVDTKMKIISEEPGYMEHEHIPTIAFDLLKSLLSKDPKGRPTLDAILSHPYLEEYGPVQREILQKKVPKVFSTKAEKKLLRNLRASHIDLEALADSVVNATCDSLAGFWALSLEREDKAQRRSKRTSLSIGKYTMSRKNSSNEKEKEKEKVKRSLTKSNQASESNPASPFVKSPTVSRFAAFSRSSVETHRDSGERSRQVSSPPTPRGAGSSTPSALGQAPVQTPDEELREQAAVTPQIEIQDMTTRPSLDTNGKSLTYSPSTKSSMSTVLAKTNEKRRELSHSFKNVMLRMILPARRRRPAEIQIAHNVTDELPQTPTHQAPPPLSPGDTSLTGSYNDSHILRPRHNFSSRPRPVSGMSQISTFSQLSQFSAMSNTSQLSSAPSTQSQPDLSSSQRRRGRPKFGRSSTSSSLSSLVSRAGRKHTKNASTSSASLDSSPVGRRTDSPGGRRGMSSRLWGTRNKGFNESAVFNTQYRVRNTRKSPFSSPRGSSTARNSLIKTVKGSVIEKVEEGEEDDDHDLIEQISKAMASKPPVSPNAATFTETEDHGDTTEDDRGRDL